MIVPERGDVIQRQRRYPLPDQLRGLALLGIVFVNMPYLALTHGGLTPAAVVASPLDQILAFLIVALAQGKFYLLFSFLFGYSLTLLLKSRRPTSGVSGLRRYRRRLLGLGVLGLLHAVFLFIGDILLSYALLGLILGWFALRRTRTALWGAGAAYAAGVLILGLVALGFITAPALTASYVALAALNTQSRLLKLAAPAGRMSLTGYLGESLLLGVIFSGWGLGWYGQLSLSVTMLITFGVWLALDVFAHLWLRRFAHGPLEWLLRWWSTGQRSALGRV